MAKKWKTEGAPVPLFDRLVDLEPEREEEATPQRTLSKSELHESVMLELHRILNTRCIMKHDVYKQVSPLLKGYGNPELYGLFDTSRFDAANPLDRPKIENIMRKAILTFEPRLRNVVVTVQQFHKGKQSLSIIVSADVQINDMLEPLSFPIEVDGFNRVDPA